MSRPFCRAAVLAAAAALAACGNSNSGTPVGPSNDPGGVVVEPGHLSGTAMIGGATYSADGLFTKNGQLRMHIFSGDDTGIDDSFQFIGAYGPPMSPHLEGPGIIIGQYCSTQQSNRFCGTSTAASIVLDAVGAGSRTTARGEIRVGNETWSLDLIYWGGFQHFYTTFQISSLSGLYTEKLAEYAPGADVVMDIDTTGRWFFQDATTGCTGNGSLVPYTDSTNVYDVQLTIAGCSSTYARLNAQFIGFATYEPPTPQDRRDYAPRMWLSTPTGPPVALATFAADL